MTTMQRQEKPAININDYDLDRVTSEAIDALVAANNPPHLFIYDGVACSLTRNDDGSPFSFGKLTAKSLWYELMFCARFQVTKNGEVTQEGVPPFAVCRNILATPNLPFPFPSRPDDLKSFALLKKSYSGRWKPSRFKETYPGKWRRCETYTLTLTITCPKNGLDYESMLRRVLDRYPNFPYYDFTTDGIVLGEKPRRPSQ